MDVFGLDLYEAGFGEQIEGMVKELFAGKGAVRPNMVEDVYDFTIGATLNIMSRYKKPQGYKIKYLLTTADYAALGILHNPRQKFWDSMVSYEALEDYDYCKEK